MLGWLLDAKRKTLHLPEHRLERLRKLLEGITPKQQTTSLRKWRQLLGELRSMSAALPGARGLFSHLQAVLPADQDLPPNTRLRLSKRVHAAVDDLRWIIATPRERPTRWGELIPAASPHYLGTVDAAASGMGGVWLDADGGPVL